MALPRSARRRRSRLPGQRLGCWFLRIDNLGDPVSGQALAFTFPGNQRVTLPTWSAIWSQPAGART